MKEDSEGPTPVEERAQLPKSHGAQPGWAPLNPSAVLPFYYPSEGTTRSNPETFEVASADGVTLLSANYGVSRAQVAALRTLISEQTDQGVSLIAMQEFKTTNITDFPPTYRMYCGATSGGTANLVAIRRDVFEFGEFRFEQDTKEWRIVAHEVKLRIPMQGAERFTFVSLHMRSQHSHKGWVQRGVLTMLDGFPQPVILAGDINRMASRARELGHVAESLRQSGMTPEPVTEQGVESDAVVDR